MRLRREIIQYLAQAVARDLSDKGCVQISSRPREGGGIFSVKSSPMTCRLKIG